MTRVLVWKELREQGTVLVALLAPRRTRRAAALALRVPPLLDWTGRRPALDPVRRALGKLIRAERVEPHTAPPLVATVHHLVDRGDAEAYRTRVTAMLASGEAPLLAVRGPFPPYAFASGNGE